MDKTTLQVPVSKNLRAMAEQAAADYGFSSLQEVIRIFMKKLAQRTINISFEEVTPLSTKMQKRLEKMEVDFEKGKNIYSAETIKDFKEQFTG